MVCGHDKVRTLERMHFNLHARRIDLMECSYRFCEVTNFIK